MLTRIYSSWWRWCPRATHAPNFVTSRQDFYIESRKSVIDLKKVWSTRIILKRVISERNGRTGVVLSKREPVGTCADPKYQYQIKYKIIPLKAFDTCLKGLWAYSSLILTDLVFSSEEFISNWFSSLEMCFHEKNDWLS